MRSFKLLASRLARVAAFALVLGIQPGCGDTGHQEEEKNEGSREAKADRVQLTPEALEHLALEIVSAEKLTLEPTLKVSAELMAVPDRHVEVGTLVAGRIARVHVNVGDVVSAEAPLLEVDSPEVGRARAELIKSRADLEVASAAETRERQLLTQRATSQREVEVASGALKTASARHTAAQALLTTLVAGSDTKAQPEHPARVALTSPISGTVVSRQAHVGSPVDPGATLIEVVDLDELWLLADVFERDIRLVAKGQNVAVTVPAYPDEVFTGTVELIEGTIDERTRTAKVRVVLQNKDRRLRPGMFATARVAGTHDHAKEPTLAVPAAAVQTIDDHRAVFVSLGDGLFELRRVHTGERAGDQVEVLNGIEPGEKVVADGSFLLKGQLLRSTLAEEE